MLVRAVPATLAPTPAVETFRKERVPSTRLMLLAPLGVMVGVTDVNW